MGWLSWNRSNDPVEIKKQQIQTYYVFGIGGVILGLSILAFAVAFAYGDLNWLPFDQVGSKMVTIEPSWDLLKISKIIYAKYLANVIWASVGISFGVISFISAVKLDRKSN